MKAQTVKNAVIVPVGSKGGFVVKHRPPAAREALEAEVVECYKILIRGLLDLTDNIVARRGRASCRRRDVVRHDGDDPYLVVAADKGTATFSDIANGDRRANTGSGSATPSPRAARPATTTRRWASPRAAPGRLVKRHFRELGRDIQTRGFHRASASATCRATCSATACCCRAHIRLIAAFNHLHIFIDPDPDPAASFAERQRLFDLPRSSWDDYDPALISKGGGDLRAQRQIDRGVARR